MNDAERFSVSRWLTAIAADVINQQLERVPQRQQQGDAAPAPAAWRRAREERLAARWREAERHLDHLPAQQRPVVRLRFRDRLTYRAIAVQLDLPRGTVHSRLARAKEILAELREREQVEQAASTARPYDQEVARPAKAG